MDKPLVILVFFYVFYCLFLSRKIREISSILESFHKYTVVNEKETTSPSINIASSHELRVTKHNGTESMKKSVIIKNTTVTQIGDVPSTIIKSEQSNVTNFTIIPINGTSNKQNNTLIVLSNVTQAPCVQETTRSNTTIELRNITKISPSATLQPDVDTETEDEDDSSDNDNSKPIAVKKSKRKVLWRNRGSQNIPQKRPVYPINKHRKAEPVVNYEYDAEYHNRTTVELVLFTTAECAKRAVPYDVASNIRMLSFFQKQYSFKGIMFSKSQHIQQFCEKLNVTVIPHYLKNPYKMPYIRDLFQQASHYWPGLYYGYINSDVVLDSEIFKLLHSVMTKTKKKLIPKNIEIAGRVYDTRYRATAHIRDLATLNIFIERGLSRATRLRNADSADYFIFSKYFPFEKMKDAVVGRVKIDNYLISLMYETGGYLIDATHRVKAIHIGLEGFAAKQHYQKQKASDMYWNILYIPNMYEKKGSLVYANWAPAAKSIA